MLRYYAIVFLSGAAVMAFEILSARAIAPVYGQSLHVWASIIGLTLGALTLGYYAGGALIDRRPNAAVLSAALLASAVFCVLMVLVARPILLLTEPLGLQFGAIVAGFLILLGPLSTLGMITPMATRLATISVDRVGKTAGNIYAVSTLGGILASFGCGFYTIPYWGILATALVTAGALVVAAIVAGVPGRLKAAAGAAALLVLGAAPAQSLWAPAPNPNVPYRSDGLMGQVVVCDQGAQRWLFIDGVVQTLCHRESARSDFLYIHCMSWFAGHYPEKSRALVLGLGGGTLATELARLGYEVDAVEIDARIARVARDYFQLHPSVRVHVDDARHFVRSTPHRYRFIAIDCFTAEREPTHLFTVESLLEMKDRMEPDGVLVTDYRPYLAGHRGKGARSLLRTIRAAGFADRCYGTLPGEEFRDLILVGMLDPAVFDGTRGSRIDPGCCGKASKIMLANRLTTEVDDGYLLTDDASPLDALNLEYHEVWRQGCRRTFELLVERSPSR
jgi:spermidine synthase